MRLLDNIKKHFTWNTKIEILKLLSSREMYGYEIWREISKNKRMHVQAVYAHLKELEKERLVKSRKGSYKLFYKITTRGKKFLKRGYIPKRKNGKEHRSTIEEKRNGDKMICDNCGDEIIGTPYANEEGIFCNKLCAYHFEEHKLLYGHREEVVDLDKVWERKRRK